MGNAMVAVAQMTRHEFTFAVRTVGPGPPTEVRVRRFLKQIARRHGLKVHWPEQRMPATRRKDGNPTHVAGGT